MATRHGVTAVEGHGFKFHTDFFEPFIIFNTAVCDMTSEFWMCQTAACLHDVLKEQIRIILDAGSFLHVGTGSSNSAAVDDGVAAVGRHFVDDENVLNALFVSFNGSSQSGKTRAYNQEIDRFVPLGGSFYSLCESRDRHNAGSTNSSQRTEEATTRKIIVHLYLHIFLFRSGRKAVYSFPSGGSESSFSYEGKVNFQFVLDLPVKDTCVLRAYPK